MSSVDLPMCVFSGGAVPLETILMAAATYVVGLGTVRFMIIAWCIQRLMRLGRIRLEMDCVMVFERDEWQAAYMFWLASTEPG